jgi:glycosyltransferase involved in cell wall biosynthesis
MKVLYFILSISFGVLLLANFVWIIFNIYMFLVSGIESIITGQTLIENIYYSVFLRWLILADIVWLIIGLGYVLKRKSYKTDSNLHYLQNSPIKERQICVIMPTFNEESTIKQVVEDFQRQNFVEYVVVIDNNSTDNTVKIAKECGVKVIEKIENKGYSHSLVLGLKEALKTDANIITITESDGTFNGYDLEKMVPYLNNCDMVIGSRQNQVISEKGNQNSGFFVWANFLLAKLIQIKYLSLDHMGIINLTDVGCIYRVIKRDALEKIISKLTYPGSDRPVGGIGIGLYITMLGIEEDLKIIEIPVTFKRRIGKSKLTGAGKKKTINIGLRFLWLILTC